MGDFSEILIRHLTAGTGLSIDLRRRWGIGEFAGKCGVSDGTIGNWRNGTTLPTKAAMDRIKSVLFGRVPSNDTPQYAEWRRELQAAYEVARQARNADERNHSTEARVDDRPSQKDDTTTSEPPPPSMARFSKLPVSVPAHFLGREEQLTQIATLLHSTSDRVIPVILFGMRGVGKTTLAAAYADEHGSDYRFVWSIRAESAFSMREGLSTLGQRLGWNTGRENLEVAAQTVLDRLAKEDSGILLIFDNAETSNSVAPYLPRGGKCHIIITSNSYAWRGVGTPIEIEVWPPQIGAHFFTERSGKQSTSSVTERLSIALDGLPLAHEVAAATCENTNISIDGYLERFSANPITLLGDHRYAPVDYYGGVAVSRAFEMALEAANRMHPACGILISYASYLPAGPIPHCLFTLGLQHTGEKRRGVSFTEIEIVEALGILKGFALVKDSSLWPGSILESGRTPQAMQIHRLIRIVAANYAIKSGIITELSEDRLIDVLKAAFGKCDFFDAEPIGRTGNYNILIDYLRRLDQMTEFGDKLSSESKKYMSQKYVEHGRNFWAWPH